MKATRWLRRVALTASTVALLGCASLLPKATPPPAFYALGSAQEIAAPAQSGAATGPTLIVGPPRAASGFDSAQMIYIRQPHRLERFADSEWVDTPARMAHSLIVAALAPGTHWRVVVSGSSAAAGDLRLDTELIRLQHDFTRSPSRVRLTLRATLVDTASRRVLAWREIDAGAVAPSEDAYGGVLAAQRAMQAALISLRDFCEETAVHWKSAPPSR
jgi:cholesterol transport system auxiliary component